MEMVTFRAASPTPARPRRRTVAIVVMALTLFGALMVRDAPQAAATASDEAAFVSRINNLRANAGLPTLTVDVQLANLARAHTQEMADAGYIFHASPLAAGYTGPWLRMGENVGFGPSVSNLMNAFVASPSHYSNLTDPGFTHVGVGVVWKGGTLYTTHRFLEAPPTTTTTTTTTTTQPPTTTKAPTTTTAPPSGPTTTAPPSQPTTTTTVPDLASPTALAPADVDAGRIVALLQLLEQIGT